MQVIKGPLMIYIRKNNQQWSIDDLNFRFQVNNGGLMVYFSGIRPTCRVFDFLSGNLGPTFYIWIKADWLLYCTRAFSKTSKKSCPLGKFAGFTKCEQDSLAGHVID